MCATLTPPPKLGIGAAALMIVLLAVWFWLHRDDCPDRALVLAAALLAVAIPFFLPHMHDRYFFAADALTLALAAAWPQLTLPAVLCEFASLLGYHAYLRMRYLLPMADGALALIATLIILAAALALELRQSAPLNDKMKKIDLSQKFVVDIPRFSVIITHAFEKCICGSAGIGRQAGLRCLCPTIDVWVQVPSPHQKSVSIIRCLPIFILHSYSYLLTIHSYLFTI